MDESNSTLRTLAIWASFLGVGMLLVKSVQAFMLAFATEGIMYYVCGFSMLAMVGLGIFLTVRMALTSEENPLFMAINPISLITFGELLSYLGSDFEHMHEFSLLSLIFGILSSGFGIVATLFIRGSKPRVGGILSLIYVSDVLTMSIVSLITTCITMSTISTPTIGGYIPSFLAIILQDAAGVLSIVLVFKLVIFGREERDEFYDGSLESTLEPEQPIIPNNEIVPPAPSIAPQPSQKPAQPLVNNGGNVPPAPVIVPQKPVVSADQVIEELKKWKELLDQGVLTQEEFNDIKAKTLHKMGD